MRMSMVSILSVLLCLLLSSCASTPKGATKLEEAELHYQIGAVQLRNENYADALVEFTRAVNLVPDKAEYYNALGLAYGARKMDEKAEENLIKATELDPEYSEAFLNLGAFYIGSRQWDKSIEASRGALNNVFYQTPEIAHNNIGWAYLNKADHQAALAAFKRSSELNTRYPMAYYNMGLTFERMNRPDDAVRSYNMAISRDPQFVNPYYDLGVLLVNMDDIDGAVEVFNKVLDIDPGGFFGLRARDQLDRLTGENSR